MLKEKNMNQRLAMNEGVAYKKGECAEKRRFKAEQIKDEKQEIAFAL